MDSLEVNKATAAVLVTGIVFFLCGVVADNLVVTHRLEKSAIAIEGAAATTEAAPAADPPIEALLATADPAKGKTLTGQAGCVACHTFTDGGKPGIGPNLYGVVGGPHAHEQGFAYSDALKAKTGPWTFDELYQWLKKPSAYAPGTKMTFAGLANPQQRADIIDYLHTLSANPVPLPPPPAAAPAAAAAPAGTPAAVPAATPPAGAPPTTPAAPKPPTMSAPGGLVTPAKPAAPAAAAPAAAAPAAAATPATPAPAPPK